jgi:hypothetical protein
MVAMILIETTEEISIEVDYVNKNFRPTEWNECPFEIDRVSKVNIHNFKFNNN